MIILIIRKFTKKETNSNHDYQKNSWKHLPFKEH